MPTMLAAQCLSMHAYGVPLKDPIIECKTAFDAGRQSPTPFQIELFRFVILFNFNLTVFAKVK